MKKLNKLLLVILLLIGITGCTNNNIATDIENNVVDDVDEELTPINYTIDTSTIIKYNTAEDVEKEDRKLIVNNITLLLDNTYYTIVVNDSINYRNGNNYFSTSKFNIELTNKQTEVGIQRLDDENYRVSQSIDEDVYLLVEGKDLDAIKNLYSNVYKANKPTYQMFGHNIAEEWTKDVIITPECISFSNGEDMIYVYHNPGSPDGPTIFYKPLEFDIPITYPEVEGLDYNYNIFKEHTPLTVNGYVPYSAYDFGNIELTVDKQEQKDSYRREVTEESSNYIILAKDNDTLKSLFFDLSENKSLLALTVTFTDKKVELDEIDITEEDLSDIPSWTNDIVNSDNRYHTQMLIDKKQLVEETIKVTEYNDYHTIITNDILTNEPIIRNDGHTVRVDVSTDSDYYIDGQQGYEYEGIAELNHPETEYIFGEMKGKLFIPDLMYVTPTYEGETKLMSEMLDDYTRDCWYAKQNEFQAKTNDRKTDFIFKSIEAHGSHVQEGLTHLKSFKTYSYGQTFGVRELSKPGQFVYLKEKSKLFIYRIEKQTIEADGEGWGSDINLANEDIGNDEFYDLYLGSCHMDAYDSVGIQYPGIVTRCTLVSVININK